MNRKTIKNTHHHTPVNPLIIASVVFGLLVFPAYLLADKSGNATNNPVVRLQTTAGNIDIELYPAKSPLTVKNFLAYVDNGFYKGTIFHRVIKGFMIQGGGFTSGIKNKKEDLKANIKNEADNGLKNKTGTIAMARLPQPHTASSQFFINTNDNLNLDHTGKTATGWGYAVFGKVIKGMDVVGKIENAATATIGYYLNVPKTEVIITKAWVLNKDKMKKK
ncbi:MAG: peptidylprolyl isomerase [Acidiferrobacterales bacterium]